MRPSDLDHLAVPEDPQLHPDGQRVAYVLAELDVEDDRTLRTVHLFDGHRTRRFTHGPADRAPRWSPDGRWLAFLRAGAGDDEPPQLAVLPADGGEAQRRTDVPLGVSDLAWSPDSSALVVVGTEHEPDVADLDEDERRRRPQRITRLPYRSDGQGWLHDRRDQLWLVTATGDVEPTRLEVDLRSPSAPVWRPDGRAVAFLAEPPDRPETEPHEQPFELDLDSGQLRPLADPGMWAAVHYGPGGQVFLTGLRDPLDWPDTQRLWLVTGRAADAASEGAAAGSDEVADRWSYVDLTGHLDRDVAPGSPAGATIGPRFVDDGLLTVLEDRGSIGVVHVRLEGWDPASGQPPEVTPVVSGRRCVTGFAARPDRSAFAFTVTDPATPGELMWSQQGRERCVTDLSRGLRTRVDVRPTQRFRFSRDDAELDAWAVLPAGFDAAAPASVPVVFNVHGGPTAQYGEMFSDEFQVQAGAGYLAVGSNPRGSSGRGRSWARAVVGAWMQGDSVDTLDLEALVDATLERFPQADPDRLVLQGGSYGGYATARLLARTDRFRSAIVERGLLQWESFCGTSDIGPYFDRMFLGTSLLDGAAPHREASPTGTAGAITTPTLVLHSEQDWRCPIEQGEQFFAALKRAGVPTEMVRFPDEGHELTRSGAPRHRVERHEIVLEWHARWGATPTSR